VPSRDPQQNASPRTTYRGIVTVSPQLLPEREMELAKAEENIWVDSLIKVNADGDPVGDHKISEQEARLVIADEQWLGARLKSVGRRYGVTPGGDGFHKRTARIQLFGLRLERHALDCQRCRDGWAMDSRQGCHWWSSLAQESKIFNEGVWGPAGQARNLLGIFGLNVEDHRKQCDYCSIGASFTLRLTCPWWRRICNERPDDVDLESLISIGRSETQKALDDQFILLGDLHHSTCICFQKPARTLGALLDCHWWLDIQRLKGGHEGEERRVPVKHKRDVIQNMSTEEAAELDPGAELTEVMGEEIYDVVFGEKVQNHARRCRWCLKGGLLWIRENCPTWHKLVELKPENITRDMLIRLTSSAANHPMDDHRKGAAARLSFLRRVEYHSKTCTKCYRDGKFKVVSWCSDWNEVLGHKPDDVSNFDVLTLAYTAAGYTQDGNVFQDGCLGLDYFLDGSGEDEIQTLRNDAEYSIHRSAQMSQTVLNSLVQCNVEPTPRMFKLVVCNPDPEPTEQLSEPVEELQSHDKLCKMCLGGERVDRHCGWRWDIQQRMVAAGGVARNGGGTSKGPVPINRDVSSKSVMPLNGDLSEVPMQEPSRPMIDVPMNGYVSEGPANGNIDSISEVPMKDNNSVTSEVSTIESVSSGTDGGVPLREIPSFRSEVRMGNFSGLPKNTTIYPNTQGRHNYIFP